MLSILSLALTLSSALASSELGQTYEQMRECVTKTSARLHYSAPQYWEPVASAIRYEARNGVKGFYFFENDSIYFFPYDVTPRLPKVYDEARFELLVNIYGEQESRFLEFAVNKQGEVSYIGRTAPNLGWIILRERILKFRPQNQFKEGYLRIFDNERCPGPYEILNGDYALYPVKHAVRHEYWDIKYGWNNIGTRYWRTSYTLQSNDGQNVEHLPYDHAAFDSNLAALKNRYQALASEAAINAVALDDDSVALYRDEVVLKAIANVHPDRSIYRGSKLESIIPNLIKQLDACALVKDEKVSQAVQKKRDGLIKLLEDSRKL